MKVILVRPVVTGLKRLNAVPPIGLGYLSSALKKAGFQVKIIDCVCRDYTLEKLITIIEEELPAILGFQTYSQDVDIVNKCINIVKKIKPALINIVGGPHPSGVKEKIYESMPEADFAFQGEAEIGLVQLSEIIQQKKSPTSIDTAELAPIPGLIWRRDGRVYANPRNFIKNLDELEFPDWELIDPRAYPHAPHGVIFKNFPVAPIIATRGCPFLCTFCSGHTISGRTIRKRSIENVIAEIKILNNRYQVKEIHILDDNFAFNKEYITDFCSSLLKNNLKISWCCPNGLRLDSLTADTVRLMKDSGCYYISVGIESGVDRILKAMRKNLTVEQIRKQVLMIKRTGIDVNGFFIIGYPGETESDMRQTINFAKSLPLTRAAFFNFMPLPNTEIYETLREEKGLRDVDWSGLFQGNVAYATGGIPKARLKSLQRKAYREFYLRPGTFLNLVSKIKSFNQLRYIIKRALMFS